MNPATLEDKTRKTAVTKRKPFATYWIVSLGFAIFCTPLLGAQTPQTEFRKGVLYGKVVDLDGKPVPNATIALQDKNGKVVTWTTSDAQGDYALAADPMDALNLRPSRRRSLLEKCVIGVGDVVLTPVKIVANAAANPGKTIKNGVDAVITGTPAPLAAQAAAGIPGKGTAAETAKNARDLAARIAVGEGPYSAQNRAKGTKGQARILIAAPNYKDGKITAGAFWMEDPVQDKTHPIGMQAWLETIKMAPAGNAKISDVEPQALTLVEASVTPTLAPAGSTVTIQVKLKSPPGPEHRVRVFAREFRKDKVIELIPKDGPDKTIFTGIMIIDPKTPPGESTICIGAIRAAPMGFKLDPKKPDPLPPFVKELDDMKAGKPYEYDPRIMASENRLDVKVNVLPVKKG